jgi:hypothetical protein
LMRPGMASGLATHTSSSRPSGSRKNTLSTCPKSVTKPSVQAFLRQPTLDLGAEHLLVELDEASEIGSQHRHVIEPCQHVSPLRRRSTVACRLDRRS